MIRKLALGVVAAATMTLFMGGTASAEVCSRYVVAGTGNLSLTGFGARLSARNTWRANVTRRLDGRFATTSRARQIQEICNKYGRRTQCRYLARPCRA